MKNLIGDTLEKIRENANSRLDDGFSNGYDKPANICIEAINKRIDGLHKQINDDKFLSNQEQSLLAQLNELKREIEDRLCNLAIIRN